MKNRSIEIILDAQFFLPLSLQIELAEWLTTIDQPVIWKQELSAKKIVLSSLKNSPPIHMS